MAIVSQTKSQITTIIPSPCNFSKTAAKGQIEIPEYLLEVR